MNNPKIFTIPAKKMPPTGCLIFLHGSGDNGVNLGQTFLHLKKCTASFPHIYILFPTSSTIHFTPYNMKVNTWYNISSFCTKGIECKEDIDKSAQQILDLIKEQVNLGIPMNRIAIGGFSRGGAMSYHIGYCYATELAGVGVLSSFLPESSTLFEELKKRKDSKNLPPLFQAHGEKDPVVSHECALSTKSALEQMGVIGEFKLYPEVTHELTRGVLRDFYRFILRVIPDV